MKAAAISWKIRPISSSDEFLAHLRELLTLAKDQGAEVAVLPELLVLELLHLYPGTAEEDVPGVLSTHLISYQRELLNLAVGLEMTIVGGSQFVPAGRHLLNACTVGYPSGGVSTHVKNKLTQYESSVWRLGRGTNLGLCEDPGLGVTICYDCEFPESGRALAQAGVLLQCVPSFTETRYGFQRVRWSCHARAIENQIFVIHSSLVGDLGGEPVPSTYGTSAILTPSIAPFPESAVLAETALNEEGVAVADLDFQLLFAARGQGDVRNWADRYHSWRM